MIEDDLTMKKIYLGVLFLFGIQCLWVHAKDKPVQSAIAIDAVYLAQTHVNQPDAPYFNLTANRTALLKVHVTSPDKIAAPEINAEIILSGKRILLKLEGPGVLPEYVASEPGKENHTFADSFTTMIPEEWIKPGLSIKITAGDTAVSHDINVGAPNVMNMTMFDIDYFGLGAKRGIKDYQEGTFDELEAKWPASELNIQRVRGIQFNELVIPARHSVGSSNVRVKSKEEYKEKTGLRFDGEQAAALQWVHALSAAGGNHDIAMCYVNIIGVPAGGQAGGFDGVGYIGAKGIMHHELGHAFGLPHWGAYKKYPYGGEMHGIPAPPTEVHVGPVWGFDHRLRKFIPPTMQFTVKHGKSVFEKGMYKPDPMQGGGHGKQEAPFLLNHFSDYSVYRMQQYIEKKLAVLKNGEFYRWNSEQGDYSSQVSNTDNKGVRYPLETDLDIISVMVACTLSDKTVNLVYPPIGPYTGNLIMTFDPRDPEQRALAVKKHYLPKGKSDFSLRIIQGGKESFYMLPADGFENDDPKQSRSLKTVAVNVRASDGEVTTAELLYTPNVQLNGLEESPEVLDTWSK